MRTTIKGATMGERWKGGISQTSAAQSVLITTDFWTRQNIRVHLWSRSLFSTLSFFRFPRKVRIIVLFSKYVWRSCHIEP